MNLHYPWLFKSVDLPTTKKLGPVVHVLQIETAILILCFQLEYLISWVPETQHCWFSENLKAYVASLDTHSISIRWLTSELYICSIFLRKVLLRLHQSIAFLFASFLFSPHCHHLCITFSLCFSITSSLPVQPLTPSFTYLYILPYFAYFPMSVLKSASPIPFFSSC